MHNTLTPLNLSVGVGIEKFKSLYVMAVTDDLHLLGKTLFKTNAIFLALSFYLKDKGFLRYSLFNLTWSNDVFVKIIRKMSNSYATINNLSNRI